MRKQYLSSLAKSVAPRVLRQTLGNVEPDIRVAGTAVQIEFRSVVHQWEKRGVQSSAMAISRLTCRLLEEAITPFGGEAISIGTNRISLVFEGENHEQRASQCALAARELAIASNLADSGISPQLAISVTTGDLWLPLIGDVRQRVIAFAGPCGRACAELQSLAGPKDVLVDAATAEALGEGAQLVLRRPGVYALVEMQTPKTLSATPPRPNVGSVEDVEKAIENLEALVVPPLAKRLRYVPNDWRTEAEQRQVVLVLTEVRGLRVSNLELINELSQLFVGAHRDSGGLVLSLQSTVAGHQVLTVYGLQSPTENDEERAVMASRQMMLDLEAVSAQAGVEIELRSVVHRGKVHFGAFGTNERYGMSVVGQPFTETEIMLRGAKGGELVTSSAVLERLGSGFVARSVVDPVKEEAGIDVGLHVIDEISHSKSRYMRIRGEAREIAGHGTMMRDLRAVVDDAFDGTAALVGLWGEAGCGKTYLLAPIVDQWLAAGGFGVIGHCRYETRQTPLAPVTSMLLSFAGVSDEAPAEEQETTIRGAFSKYCNGDELDDLVSLLLSRCGEVDAPALVHESDPRWEHLLLTIENFVLSRIKEKPLLYVMEDMHLADSMTLRVASRLAAMSRDQAFLFVGTYRRTSALDDFVERIDCEFEVRNLGLRETRDFILNYFSEEAVDENLAIQLWERTRGNARQLAELLSFLRERGLLVARSGKVQGEQLTSALLSQFAPPAMEKQALARLDQIRPDDRRVLHMAAAIGTTVPCSVLRELIPGSWNERGKPAVSSLMDEGILVTEFANTPSYRFRDDQVRIVAYSTIPIDRRRELHGQIADIIERLHPGDHDHRAPTLASHRERAGHVALAMHWYGRAAKRSASLMLDAETVEFVDRWHALAESLPLGHEPPVSERSKMAVLRFVATARHFGAEDALEQARHIAATFRNSMTKHDKAVCDLWHGAALMAVGQKNSAKARLSRAYECETYASVRCDAAVRLAKCMMDNPVAASKWLERAASLVSKPNSYWADRVELARACQAVAEGKLDEARILNMRVRDRAQRGGRVRLAAIATSNLADCDLQSGDVEDARRGFAEANIMSRSLGTRTDKAIDALNRGVSEFYVGNIGVARSHLEQSMSIADEVGCKFVSNEARIYLGIVLALQGEIDRGEEICVATRVDIEGDESLEYLTDLNLLHVAILRSDKSSTNDLLQRCKRFDSDKLSPLLRDRFSQLRAMARPVLRA